MRRTSSLACYHFSQAMRNVPSFVGPRLSVALIFLYVFGTFSVMGAEAEVEDDVGSKGMVFPETFPQKLMQSDSRSAGSSANTLSNACSKDDIAIYQAPSTPLPNGIPSYSVQILNKNLNHHVSNIHVRCGWFSSAKLVNPRVFRRLSYDNCLVNDGQPLAPGQALSFQYATTFMYPLSVSSVDCRS